MDENIEKHERLCVLCGNEIPDSVPLSVYNQIIDKCEDCYEKNTPFLDIAIPKSKTFSVRIKLTERVEETNDKIEGLIKKVEDYKKHQQ